jgi:hypothetical protein
VSISGDLAQGKLALQAFLAQLMSGLKERKSMEFEEFFHLTALSNG